MRFDMARECQPVVAESARVSISQGSDDSSLDALAEHCIAVRQIIEKDGSPLMRCLTDLLLFEIGTKLAADMKARGETSKPDDRN